MRVRPFLAFLIMVVPSLTLAGCLSDTDQPGLDLPDDHIARAYTVTLDENSETDLAEAETPSEALRQVLKTTLVVRAGSAGVHTLRYTDQEGAVQSVELIMVPGEPQRVEGADPFAAATLVRGDEAVATRAPVPFDDGFMAGEMPLGVHASPGHLASYQARATMRVDQAIHDVTWTPPQGGDGGDEGGSPPTVHLDTAAFRARLAVEATVGVAAVDDAGQTRVDFDFAFSTPTPTEPLLLAEALGTVDDTAFDVGAELSDIDFDAEAAYALWFEANQLKAAQFNGGSYHIDPTVVAWAVGPEDYAGAAGSCAGRARADRCEPEEIEAMDQTEPASEKEMLDESDFGTDDPDAQAIIAFLEQVFAHDLREGDSFIVTAHYEDEMSSMTFVYSLQATARERVTVPAGSFDALRLVQETRMAARVADPTAESSDVDLVDIDETFTRTTAWLDTATWLPVKVETETPLDASAIMADVLGNVREEMWQELGLSPIDASDITIASTATATMEATQMAGDARVAPLVGLGLSGVLSGAYAPLGVLLVAPAYATGRAFEEGYDEAPAVRAISISLSSAGPIHQDGLFNTKDYTVASSTSGNSWFDLNMELNGEMSRFAASPEEANSEGSSWYWCVVTSTDGCDDQARYDAIEAGQTLRIGSLTPISGSQLRVMDAAANAVILALTVS